MFVLIEILYYSIIYCKYIQWRPEWVLSGYNFLSGYNGKPYQWFMHQKVTIVKAVFQWCA